MNQNPSIQKIKAINIKNQQNISKKFIKKTPPIKGHIRFLEEQTYKYSQVKNNKNLDSIKPIGVCEYENNKFMIQPQSAKERALQSYSSQQISGSSAKNTINVNQLIPSPCLGIINPMYINLKANPKRLISGSIIGRQKNIIYNNNSASSSGNKINTIKKNKKGQNCRINFNMNQKVQFQFEGVINSTQNQHQKQKTDCFPSHKSQMLYSKIVQEMNQYFNSMKLVSFKNNRAQSFSSKRNIKTQSQYQKRINLKHNFQDYHPKGYNKNKNFYKPQQVIRKQPLQHEVFNVISLRPKNIAYRKVNRNLFSVANSQKISQFNQIDDAQSILIRSNQQIVISSNHQTINKQDLNLNKFFQNNQQKCYFEPISSMIINNNIYSNQISKVKQMVKSGSFQRPLTQSLKVQSTKNSKLSNGYLFGQLNNPRLNVEDIYKLKILYYKDLIWKNSLNMGIRFTLNNKEKDNSSELRYFVGKGNNSKLIKRIMSKRWWWSVDSKEENAHFLWTQLKIYSIYQKQLQYPTKSIQFLQNYEHELNPELKSQIKPQTKSQIKSQKQKKPLDKSQAILNKDNKLKWLTYITNRQNAERQKKVTQQKLQYIRQKLIKKLPQFQMIRSPKKMTNHLQFSKVIGNKKALYKVMMLYFNKVKKYSPDQIYVPLTFHITAGLQDQEYLKFLSEYYRRNKNDNKTCWIVKPGEMTNRGRGIQYCRDLNEIKPIVKKKQTHPNGTLKTFLIQQYLDRPLLYKGRKFDIRHYLMFTSINGKIRGYFYEQGYIRTTSYKYKLNDNSPAIHLTNDAVQKYCKDYGKYQKGNKLSYKEFDNYLQQQNNGQKKKSIFYETILPQIRNISKDIVHAAYYFIDPKRKINNFQILGLDIMIDQNYKCYLIEVNTNPCLQLSSPVLQKVIPDMLDNAFALTIDTCYPPPQSLTKYHKKFNYPISPENKFQLVFDEDQDSKQIHKIFIKQNVQPYQMSGIGDDDENYQSCDDEEDC